MTAPSSPAVAGIAETWRGEFSLHGVRLPLGADDRGRILDSNGDVVASITDDGRGHLARAALARLIAEAVNRATGTERSS